MKTLLNISGLAFFSLLAATSLVSAQSFVNLDFEDAVIVEYHSLPGGVDAGQAVPGWTVRRGSDVIDFVFYNEILVLFTTADPILMGPEVPLEASGTSGPPWGPIIQGQYTFYMLTYAHEENPQLPSEVSISQTGLVPSDALSIRLLALTSVLNEPYTVSIGGQQIPMIAVSASGDVTELAGNITAFAGTTSELRITCKSIIDGVGNTVGNGFAFDAITLSPEVVPEPATILLLAFGGLAMLRRRRLG